MDQSELFALRDGMEEVNREMVKDIEEAAPICHGRPMCYEPFDSIDGYYTTWWECSICGHTKDI